MKRLDEKLFQSAIACKKTAAIRPVVRLVGNARREECARHEVGVADSVLGLFPVVVEHVLEVREKLAAGVKKFMEAIEALLGANCFYMFVFHGRYCITTGH